MSDLAPRTPRAVRERRANQLVMVGGTSGVIALVGWLLVIVGVIGSGVPLIATILAAVCLLLFRQMIKPR